MPSGPNRVSRIGTLEGNSLVHFDMRSDSICLVTDGPSSRVMLVHWYWYWYWWVIAKPPLQIVALPTPDYSPRRTARAAGRAS